VLLYSYDEEIERRIVTMTTMLGLMAAVLTTSCWAPQLVRSYRTRSTGDISWAYILALGSGIVLWLGYGTIRGDTALVAANFATVLAVGWLGWLKHSFDSKGRAPAPALRRIGAVLLDMDGTLVDSHAAVERAWRRWAEEFDIDHARIAPIMHGSPAETTVRLVAPGLAEEAVDAAARRQLELQYDDVEDVTLAPGARDLLQWLASSSLPWAVVTSADARLARARLDAAGVHPRVLVTVDDVAVGKPDPEGFLLAAKRLGVQIGRCLVVEDSAPGAEAGRRAGAVVAGLRGLPADVPVDDLSEVAMLLQPAA
jgi:mannitol-1-/sugar-/sorbitol-6-phosphatase